MSRIVVTGGSGFIGTNLIEYLWLAGHRVTSLDIKDPSLDTHARFFKRVDIRHAEALSAALAEADPEFIVHLAARTDLNGASVSDYDSNTVGVENLIKAASRTSVRRVIFASSRLVCRIGYEPRSSTDFVPTTPYGESKVVGEKLLRDDPHLPFEWCIVRPTSIWGPWFHIPYRNFFDAIRHGRYIHPKGVRVRKSFGFVGNTVAQIAALLDAPSSSFEQGLFYLADYEPIEVLEWGRQVQAAFDAAPIAQIPVSALRVAANVGDVLSRLGWKNVPLTSFRLDNLMTEMLHDTANLQAVCKELPFGVHHGVKATVEWMQTTRH